MHLCGAKSNTKGNYEIGEAMISKRQSNYGRWKIDEMDIRVLTSQNHETTAGRVDVEPRQK
jgi:hypothetical protein